jgi:hypothetical protein
MFLPQTVAEKFWLKKSEFKTDQRFRGVSIHVAMRRGGPTEMLTRFIGFFREDDQSGRFFIGGSAAPQGFRSILSAD